jgi:hypothetical protein
MLFNSNSVELHGLQGASLWRLWLFVTIDSGRDFEDGVAVDRSRGDVLEWGIKFEFTVKSSAGLTPRVTWSHGRDVCQQCFEPSSSKDTISATTRTSKSSEHPSRHGGHEALRASLPLKQVLPNVISISMAAEARGTHWIEHSILKRGVVARG